MQKIAGVFFLILIPALALAQKDSLNADKLYASAREMAQSHQLKEARERARMVLNLNNAYYDARILIGRTYAWEAQYDSALLELSKVIRVDSSNTDALAAITDVDYWWGHYNEALTECDRALSISPNDKDLLLKKVKILLAMGREDEARDILAVLLKIDPNGAEINAMLSNLRKYRNRIIIEHTFDYFAIPYHQRWHETSLEYQRDTKIGAIIGKINIGQKVAALELYLSRPELQLEAEAYPIVAPGTYLYLNYGIAPGNFFPQQKFGFEPFHALGNGWECSLGMRYLHFKWPPDVKIVTWSVSKYSQNNLWSLRPYFVFDGNFSQSWYLQFRHYYSLKFNYAGIVVGVGNSPDDRYANIHNFLQNPVSGYHARIEFQHIITSHILIRLMPECAYEKYTMSDYRIRYTGNIYLAYLF